MTHEQHFRHINQTMLQVETCNIIQEIENASMIVRNLQTWRHEQQKQINHHSDRVIRTIRRGVRPTGLRHHPFSGVFDR